MVLAAPCLTKHWRFTHATLARPAVCKAEKIASVEAETVKKPDTKIPWERLQKEVFVCPNSR